MGIPVLLFDGSGGSSGSGSPSGAVIASVSVGSLVVVGIYPQTVGGTVPVSLIDSAGNNYSIAAQAPQAAGFLNLSIYFCYVKNALVSGVTTFTATTTAGDTISYIAYAVQTPAVGGGFDASNITTSVSGGVTVATGGLAQATEIVFGAYNPNGNTTFTEAPGWTTLIASPGNEDLSYQIVSSKTSVTYNPTWPQTVNANGAIASFKFLLLPTFDVEMGAGYRRTLVTAY